MVDQLRPRADTRGKRVAVLQSNYIPWKGYFDIISKVDTFVFYDDVQYTKNDWRNRNRIKTVHGPQWLTIPVGVRLDRKISEVVISDSRWQRKHWSTLKQTYAKSRCIAECESLLDLIYVERQWERLSELNQFVCRDWMRLSTEFRSSEEFQLSKERNSRLLELLIAVGATTYVSGPSAKSYLDESELLRHGIDVEYMDYSHYPEYIQPFPPFEHNVSILDMLFCLGHRASGYLNAILPSNTEGSTENDA
jgi:hypothetical protein